MLFEVVERPPNNATFRIQLHISGLEITKYHLPKVKIDKKMLTIIHQNLLVKKITHLKISSK